MLLRLSLALLAVLALGLVVGLPGPSRADDAASRHIVFLSITGEGPTAKAWYKGAPPAGAMVQDALDLFAAKGYRVASVSPSQRPVITTVVTDEETRVDAPALEQYFVVLLERP